MRVALALSAIPMFVPAAHAAPETCTGTGQASLGTGISYFPTITTNVSFTFQFNCAEGGSITGSGTLSTASCGRSSGRGTVPGYGDIFVETAGSMLVVAGAFTAVANATPIPDTSTVPFSNSCSNGTAKLFTLTGAGTPDVKLVDLDGDGELEVVITTDNLPAGQTVERDIDGDGDKDIVIVGTGP